MRCLYCDSEINKESFYSMFIEEDIELYICLIRLTLLSYSYIDTLPLEYLVLMELDIIINYNLQI